jgi:hypothetical protein
MDDRDREIIERKAAEARHIIEHLRRMLPTHMHDTMPPTDELFAWIEAAAIARAAVVAREMAPTLPSAQTEFFVQPPLEALRANANATEPVTLPTWRSAQGGAMRVAERLDKMARRED